MLGTLESTGVRLNNKKPEGGKGKMNLGKPQDQRDYVGSKAMNSIEVLESVSCRTIVFNFVFIYIETLEAIFAVVIHPSMQTE